jgi:hypothetical protein
MTKQKFTITDETGQEMGFLVVELPSVYEHTIPGGLALAADSPLADAALLFASLVGFTGVAWFLPGPNWIAPTLGITITATLAGIKAWRSASVTEPGGGEMTIKVETWTDEGRVLLDEIKDKSIGLDEWRKVARAVIEGGKNFSRPALAGHISQGTYHKVKAELLRLNMAHRNGNGYTLSPRGLALLRKINDLPY